MKKDNKTFERIALSYELTKERGYETTCYLVGGSISHGFSGINVLVLAYPDKIPLIGKMLGEQQGFSGSVVFCHNYGGSLWPATGQIDLIVVYDHEAGEADWLGKCYNRARKAGAPLCVEFLQGRDFVGWQDFDDKFKDFMKNVFYSKMAGLLQAPSSEKIRLLTQAEVGWIGREPLSNLKLSDALTNYLTSIGILDKTLPHKGNVWDLVNAFIMMNDNEPFFVPTNGKETEMAELLFILQQLEFFPRPKIQRNGIEIPAEGTIEDSVIEQILMNSSKNYKYNIAVSFHDDYVQLVRGVRPIGRGDERTETKTFDIPKLKGLSDGKYRLADWLEHVTYGSFFRTNKEAKIKNGYAKNSIVEKLFANAFDYRNLTIDRSLLELLIRTEEALCVPNLAFEALLPEYGRESMIPLIQLL